ncbi:CocE/NonD family hydrolase [Aspergillus novofumigatus IBT 16806]|uniref:Alpha/beta-hydrolase n=1 Tax=Aspergillus novofumigatus (strain IBT 16806) TaxID=1392255 RepID=A0A2I1C0Z7_ASPN1|nr:alpha/beta-hydrolase [Aspergillus novofumigatus IBT 16806]PKX91316.1 alpha/beta-hydrolase [Aspergillus novofumigatus IBT 16806]
MCVEGIFPDVVGLSYRSGTHEGVTTDLFKIFYEPGANITFSIGDIVLGESVGKDYISVFDLVPPGTPAFDPKVINRARLLFSLSSAQGFESPVVIDGQTRDVVGEYAWKINLDSDNTSDLDDALFCICSKLDIPYKTVSHTRNHLRRAAAGFKVMRDIPIPTRDGGNILGDVYLPLQHRKRFPVLMSCTIYGRRVFYSGPDLDDEDDIAAFEKAEDEWHSTAEDVPVRVPRGSWSPSWEAQRGFENIATFNTFTYVPHGYAMVKVDPRGVSQTPGIRGVPGELTQNFYDAVQWATEQSWSNGNIALVGSSYGANVQWNVASLRPKGLKCFVPYATDIDLYRDAAYIGGVPAGHYIADWYRRVQLCSPKWTDHQDILSIMKDHPCYDGLWDMMKSKPGPMDVPCFLAAAQIFMVHGRGAYEAWGSRNPDNTHLQLVDCNYYPLPSREASGKILQFLDHHLKGTKYPIPERVGIQMRLGYKQWYWRKESDWPVPGTRYSKWHLRSDGTVSTEAENSPEVQFAYAARVPPSGKSGESFHSAPFEDDIEFAGHFKAVLSISANVPDADFVVMLWAVNEDGSVVPYSSKGEPEPLAKGFLRASHRQTDPLRSTPERPWHTHTREDNAPLQPNEVVQLDIEVLPAAARIRKGWSLRVDICPSEYQPNIPRYNPAKMREWYGEMHHDDGGVNAIHVGNGRPNYIVCPVVPLVEGYRNLIQ